MRFHNGFWHCKGRTYATLRAALLAVWPERRGGNCGGAGLQRH